MHNFAKFPQILGLFPIGKFRSDPRTSDPQSFGCPSSTDNLGMHYSLFSGYYLIAFVSLALEGWYLVLVTSLCIFLIAVRFQLENLLTKQDNPYSLSALLLYNNIRHYGTWYVHYRTCLTRVTNG